MTTPRAIEPLATLPVFFKLEGRRVLLAGATAPAVWKAELLAAAGATVVVVAADPCPEMLALAAASGDRLTLEYRAWLACDLHGAALAIGALEGEDAETFRAAARAAGVPVNIIDLPPLCDFQFGTIVARSPLVIGISTDGAAPVFGQALRARIEALLPEGIGLWAAAAKAWRQPLQAMKLGFRERRRFWEAFTDLALDGTGRAPTDADREHCLSALEAGRTAGSPILMVGVGPGDPDMVTIQAVRALQAAETIIYEPGVASAILGLGRREATRVEVNDDTMSALKTLWSAGRQIAWVGRGDAGTCPIWSDRSTVLVEAGYPVEVVRGIRCDTCPYGCAAFETVATR